MSYDSRDIRSTLPTRPPGAIPHDIAAADHVSFTEDVRRHVIGDARFGYARGQNMVIGYGELDGSCAIEHDEVEESVMILPDTMRARISNGNDEDVTAQGRALIVVPPGRTVVELAGTGRIVRLVRVSSPLSARAVNAASYESPHPNVAEYIRWPEPVGGFRVRTYRLDTPTLGDSRFRLFRTQHFMVNYFEAGHGVRDPSSLSPHHHDDFEQCSLVLRGDYVHHLRWPWGTDSTKWRPDEHEHVSGPTATIIPPPVVHTSQSVGSGENHMIDIFSPPRADFSAMKGWVINADDYPPPTDMGGR